MPPPSSHNTVRTVPYTALPVERTGQYRFAGVLVACRIQLTRGRSILGGSAAYVRPLLRHFSLHFCVSFGHRMFRASNLNRFGPSPASKPDRPSYAVDYYGLG